MGDGLRGLGALLRWKRSRTYLAEALGTNIGGGGGAEEKGRGLGA